MKARHYIAVDLGAESGRVMLGSLADGKITLEEVHRFSNGPMRFQGTMRWDVLRLWEEIKTGLRKVASKGLPIESISVDSWGVDYVLMSRCEPMLRTPFCYRDLRTERPYAEIAGKHYDTIYSETGVQFMAINTIYQLAAEKRDAPELFGLAEGFLMIGDWFHFLLSGQAAQEESNASTTQAWNPKKREWSAKLQEIAGLPRGIFPRVVPSCTRMGKLTKTVRAETGLGEIEVVAGCVHDTAAAVAAVPAEGNGWAFLSSGTWSLLGLELPAPQISEEGRAANFTNETGVGGTTRFLRNASGLWIMQECRRSWAREGREWDYSELTAEAAAAEPFRSLVNPTDPSFLRPDNMPAAVREFCQATGQPQPETPGQFARCALESLACLYARLMGQLEAVTAQTLHTLHIVGGGSKNALLNQMTADAINRTVIAGPVEATAIGNTLLQALTLGHIGSHEELRRIVKASFPVETSKPGTAGRWQAAHARFAGFGGA
jgi:rhamnulokinase